MTRSDEQAVLRKQGLLARRSLSDAERRDYSLRISNRLERLSWFRSATTVAVYLSSWDEADTSEIILRSWCANKRVVAPVIKKNSRMIFSELTVDTVLKQNRYGLLEPATDTRVSMRDIDIVIAPLAAFDDKGARVGMGGGYYDRYFSQLTIRQHFHRPRLIGIAFACQQVKQITENPWDIPLYACVTEREAFSF